jgi:O-antigen/teichoic acid export membrane protein
VDDSGLGESLKERAAKGLFWGGVGNAVQQFVGMAFGIFIARILNPDDYGLIAMLAVFSAIATTVIDSGFAIALINKKNTTHGDYNAVFWFGSLVGLGFYGILFFAAPLIAGFFKQPALTNLARVVFLGFLIGSIGIVHRAILVKNLQTKYIGIANVCGVFFSGAIGLLLVVNGGGYWGLAAQQVAFIAFSVLLRWIFSSWRPTFHLDFAPLKSMFGFSSKMFATNIVAQLQGNMFDALFGRFFSANLLGNFSQGKKWVNMSSDVISGMLSTVTQPVFAMVNDDKNRQLRVFRKITRFSAFIAFPAFIGLAYTATEFIQITLGSKWIGSVVFLQLMCAWGVVAPFVSLYYLLLISHHKGDIILKGNIFLCLFQLAAVTLMLLMKVPAVYIVVFYVAILCSSSLYWYYHGHGLIGIRWKHTLKDVFPYLLATVGAVLLSSLLLSWVGNIYLLFAGKILSVVGFYLAVLNFFDSKVLKETIHLLMKREIV